MKRAVAPLILAFFCLGIQGAEALRLQHHLRGAFMHRLHFPILPCSGHPCSNLDMGEKPRAPSGNLVFCPKAGGEGLAVRVWANSPSPREDHRLGLGCGGLSA